MKKLRTIVVALSALLVLMSLLILELSDQKMALGQQSAKGAETSRDEKEIIREYAETRYSFDIQNGVIRFSHGNHQRRDRWFKAYFGTGYDDCGNCHNLGLLQADEVYSVVMGEGEHLNTVEAIRAVKDDIFPYGVQEASCFTCHNDVTAPANCAWCHVQDSRPLQQQEVPGMKTLVSTVAVAAKATGQEETPSFKEEPDKVIPAYKEDFKKGIDTIRDYKLKNWFFDIQNNVVRFSHGNHATRDRWFKTYFGTTFKDCGNCHNLGLPFVAEGGVLLKNGEHLNTIEDIREYEDDIYPFGIMMARCFGACHNGYTAPNDCTNCHLPGSKPLVEGLTERTL